MSNNNDDQDYFGNYNKPQDKLMVDIQADHRPIDIENIPSGYQPIGEMYAQGRGIRGMSSTGMSWWILISGWVFLGGFFFWILSIAIFSSPAILPMLLIIILPLLITIRATFRKLSNKKRPRR